MNYLKNKDYDETDAKSIESYSQNLIDKSFQDVLNDDLGNNVEESTSSYFEDRSFKGGLGNLIEQHFFHYEPNNSPDPDFPIAGVELKVTPFKKNKNGSYSAKERLVLTMIDYMTLIDESFETSHFWNKSKLLLLIHYLWKKDIDRLSYRIQYANLFSPPKQDLEIIKNDYKIIQEKVEKGLAHELSGSDTLYLEACTKAATSADRTPQPNSDIKAKPRAFAFKSSYMSYVLNNYIMKEHSDDESIIKSSTTTPFEDYIKNKISKYKDYSVEELCKKFDIDSDTKPKNLGSLIAYRILGIKGNKTSEFEKAGIVVKTIRIENNGKIREHMSFPNFKFAEIVKENWEDSTFKNYLADTRFFFVVYKYDNQGILRLKGCQFWNIPYDDLNGNVKKVWTETVNVLKKGLHISEVNGRLTNNFPKSSDNSICHVRPHARNQNDVDMLPNGDYYPKQCFWFNNNYILSQLDITL